MCRADNLLTALLAEKAWSVGANTVMPLVVVRFARARKRRFTPVAVNRLTKVWNSPALSMMWVMLTGSEAAGAGTEGGEDSGESTAAAEPKTGEEE